MDHLPQLRMMLEFDPRLAFPDVSMPPGYTLRHFEPDDVSAWVRLMQRNGELGTWDEERGRRTFFGPDWPLTLEGSFLAIHAGEPVATASLHTDVEEPEPTAVLGWVASLPEHRGKGLGYQVCLAVVRAARERGYRKIYLRTDDWRIPAIKTYLRLGFVPQVTDSSHPIRWGKILGQIGRQTSAEC